jgi:hypothetical protein
MKVSYKSEKIGVADLLGPNRVVILKAHAAAETAEVA